MNESKAMNPHMWAKWKASGAIGGLNSSEVKPQEKKAQPRLRELEGIGGEILTIAQSAADKSAGRVNLVYNQEDETEDFTPEAARFLKLDGKRIGRDIEVYNLMGKAIGWESTLVFVLEELALPLYKIPESQADAFVKLEKLGEKVYEKKDQLDAWRNVFVVLNSPDEDVSSPS